MAWMQNDIRGEMKNQNPFRKASNIDDNRNRAISLKIDSNRTQGIRWLDIATVSRVQYLLSEARIPNEKFKKPIGVSTVRDVPLQVSRYFVYKVK